MIEMNVPEINGKHTWIVKLEIFKVFHYSDIRLHSDADF